MLPAPALPEPSLQPPAPESGTRPAPSYLGSDWTSPRFPAPVPRRLLTPSAVMPARHLPWLCCQRNWPGLAPLWALEGGALTGEGRANQVRQMKSAGRGGGRGQGERRVLSTKWPRRQISLCHPPSPCINPAPCPLPTLKHSLNTHKHHTPTSCSMGTQDL